jgi:delta 1-pyrroline-5-carboxylate dehydrogenase
MLTGNTLLLLQQQQQQQQQQQAAAVAATGAAASNSSSSSKQQQAAATTAAAATRRVQLANKLRVNKQRIVTVFLWAECSKRNIFCFLHSLSPTANLKDNQR